jgi:pimeloyl-ACP methyl ester carboxylesterase
MGTDAAPATIVLIHGFWVTPRSWEHWVAHYEARGHEVLAPAYPGFDAEVEALNADPSPIERLEVSEIVARLESVVRELETPPILIGHSAGGVFVQLLLDRGLGAAGVALNSAPTEGVKVAPLSQLRAAFPVLRDPIHRDRAVGFTFEQWHYAFTNTFTEEEGRALYERYHVPASAAVFWENVLANVKPGPQDTWVNYENARRPPLLFVAGSEDNLMPPKVQRSNAAHYKAPGTVTEVKEYEGYAHLLPAQAGWEAIADEVLAWAEAQARAWSARPVTQPV